MKILGIEHIGIAVNQIDERKDFWEKVLGIKLTGQENVESESVETAIFDSDSGKIELLQSKNSDSAIQKFIDKSGEGIHHICLKVDDIDSAIGELKAAGISAIYPVPKVGAEGFLVTFIHPKDTGGVLVELAQEPS